MEAKIDELVDAPTVDELDDEPTAAHCTVYDRGDIHISTKGNFVKKVFGTGKMPTGQLQIEFHPIHEILVIRKLIVHELPEDV